MKIGLIALPPTPETRFVKGRPILSGGSIYRRTQEQVLTEYEPQLRQATGWQRRFLKWRIKFEIDVRYRNLL